MAFAQILIGQLKGMLPGLLYWTIFPLIPFIIAEQLRPVGKAPGLRDYSMNILISLSTAYLALPLGIAAGLWSTQLRSHLPWTSISLSFDSINTVPVVGPVLEVLAMIFVPLFLHDVWYYWSHRLEHRWPILWAFHRIHHSDERMNTSTWARDHFMQETWNAFFSIFTLGLIIDLNLTEAGKAALYSQLFLTVQSMFYHSAIRVQLPWLDRILVTPQVHRIHHSSDARHYNTNFADALPIFDIVFGTYCRPTKDEFPYTGLGNEFRAPRSVWSAQFGPLWSAAQLLIAYRQMLARRGNP